MGTNLGSNYSKIISPQDYNMLMSDQHLYIKISDVYMAKVIHEKVRKLDVPEILEIGCGPARITPLVWDALSATNKNVTLYGLDVDEDFIRYAQNRCKHIPVMFLNHSILSYRHDKPVDLFYSQGFHHHLPKNDKLDLYLGNIFNHLKKGGYYIVGDEFIAEYTNVSEREVNLVLWYFHIIASALSQDFNFLAQEEAKTFLDDIYEGQTESRIKSQKQIDLVLTTCTIIEKLCKARRIEEAKDQAKEFLRNLRILCNNHLSNDDTIDLSRGDFKISPSVFKSEVERAGFVVEQSKFYGPASGVGWMGVYILRKP